MSDDAKKLTRRDLFRLGAAGAGAMALGGGLVPGLPGTARAGDAAAGGTAADAPLPQVPRKKLGKTGKEIPILLFGGGAKLDPKLDPKLAEGLRFGVDYIDAADCYAGGTCETHVGNFLANHGVKRDKVWITSKSDAHDPTGFESTCRAGIKAMNTNFFDLYFLHALQETNVFTPELEKTVEKMKKEGIIRHFGFSCHDANVAELLTIAAKTPWVDAVMFRYNFREYGDKALNTAMDACAKANVGLIAMKTQSSEVSFADAWQKFQKVGKWSKQQAVLKAVWSDERMTAAVSHMDTMEKLKQNIAAACDKFELGQAEWDALERYAADTRSYACSGCEHLCNPAVDAPVRIGTTLRYLMYHDSYGQAEEARAAFAKLPAAAQRLRDVDFSPANAACPHGVDVVGHMRRAADVFLG